MFFFFSCVLSDVRAHRVLHESATLPPPPPKEPLSMNALCSSFLCPEPSSSLLQRKHSLQLRFINPAFLCVNASGRLYKFFFCIYLWLCSHSSNITTSTYHNVTGTKSKRALDQKKKKSWSSDFVMFKTELSCKTFTSYLRRLTGEFTQCHVNQTKAKYCEVWPDKETETLLNITYCFFFFFFALHLTTTIYKQSLCESNFPSFHFSLFNDSLLVKSAPLRWGEQSTKLTLNSTIISLDKICLFFFFFFFSFIYDVRTPGSRRFPCVKDNIKHRYVHGSTSDMFERTGLRFLFTGI